MADPTIALPLLVLIAIAAIGIACERYIRRHPRNRYRKIPPLPPPSPRCERQPDWRSQALQTRF